MSTDVSTQTENRRQVSGWWNKPFQVFQTNLREIDATLDVDRVLDFIEQFGADTWLLNTGGILAFHPSDLASQSRNPHLAERPGGDLLSDAVSTAHARGIRVVARMDFSKVTREVADANPDWCFVDTSGSWQVFEGLVSVCPSAAYYQQRTFEILSEVLDRYEVDGFFFNMFGFNEVDYSGRYRGVCQGESCRRGFEEWSGGRPLPTGPASEHYATWRTWCAEVVTELSARIRAHIEGIRPGAALILRQSADVLFDEANNEVGRDLWPHQTSESVSALRTARPDLPVMENSVSFLDMPYRLAGEEPEHFAQYLIQTLARGGNPSTYIMGVPGDIHYPSLARAAEVTRFHDQHADVYCGLQPASPIGLVRPSALGDHTLGEFRGIYSALDEEHLLFDVIDQDRLPAMASTGLLERFEVLVLPDVALTAEQADALRSGTNTQTGLVLTGRSGFDVAGSAVVQDAPAVAVRSTSSGPAALMSSYVAPGTGITRWGVDGPVAPVWGEFHHVEPAFGSQARAAFLAPAPYGPPEKAYGHVDSGEAGWLLSRDGRIAQAPWTVGAAYHHLGLRTLRRLIRDLVRTQTQPPQVSIQAPEQVRATLMRGLRGETVVHLRNLTGWQSRTFTTPVPIHDVVVRVAGASADTGFRSLRDPGVLGHPDGEDLVVTVPSLSDFEVVVVGPEARS